MTLAVGGSAAIAGLSVAFLAADPEKRRQEQMKETDGDELEAVSGWPGCRLGSRNRWFDRSTMMMLLQQELTSEAQQVILSIGRSCAGEEVLQH